MQLEMLGVPPWNGPEAIGNSQKCIHLFNVTSDGGSDQKACRKGILLNVDSIPNVIVVDANCCFHDLHSVFGNMSMEKRFLNDLFHAIWERLKREDEDEDEPSNRAVSHAYNLIHNDTLKEDQLQKQLATVTRPEKKILNTLSHQYSIQFARQVLPERSSVSYAYRPKFGTVTSRDPKSPRSEPIKKKKKKR